jgi:orotate phosphoribosyltransferase
VNKEKFVKMGAIAFVRLIRAMVVNAVHQGLSFHGVEEVGVVGPAYGAIPYALPVACFLEWKFPGIRFFPARTQLKEKNGRDVHYIPEKLIPDYQGRTFVGIEDIVNNGNTCREVSAVFRKQADAEVKVFLCLVNRGKQTASSLGLQGFYPLTNPDLQQFNLLEASCPLCQRGIPINTKLGKGAEWVKMFGQPPYPEGMDFSSFWQK